MTQVHKENLEKVENALPNRTDPSIEIFGTEGIPEDAVRDHTKRVIEQYQRDAEGRQLLTGNLQPGANPAEAPKRPKLHEQGDLKEKLKAFVAAKTTGQSQDYEMQDAAVANGYQQPYTNGVNAYQQPSVGQAPYGYPLPGASPSQAVGLGQPPGQPSTSSQAPAHEQPLPQPDQAMPDALQAAEADSSKKIKKEKGIKMFYSDNEVSPEEKMARMSKYAFDPAEHQPVVLGDATGAVAGAVHGYGDPVDTKQ